MSDVGPLTGRCLCGACTFEATPANRDGGVCHCKMCQKWTSGGFFGVACGADVTFAADIPLGVYVSSDWGERVFCKTCGSPLVWRTRDQTNNAVSLAAFDDVTQVPLCHEIYADHKLPGMALAGLAYSKTEAQVLDDLKAAGII